MTKEELFSIKIEEPSSEIYAKMKAHWDSLAKPIDGMGDLEEIICRIGAARGEEPEDLSKKVLAVFCADTKVVEEGVSQTRKEVTKQVAELLGQGKSTVAVLTKGYPLTILPVDVGIDCDEEIPGVWNRKVKKGAGNITKEPAMTEEECLAAIEAGMKIAEYCAKEGFQIVATGEMGIGNTTTTTALYCALTGENPEKITGRGAGLSDEGLFRKIRVVEDALTLHGLNRQEREGQKFAFRALCSVAGLDLAALTGFFTGCAMFHTPVVIDGVISAVSALTAQRICPGTKEYMIASHRGRERACEACLNDLGLSPVIDGKMALGEGTGAVLLFPILDMVFDLYKSGTVFSDTEIRQYERFVKK